MVEGVEKWPERPPVWLVGPLVPSACVERVVSAVSEGSNAIPLRASHADRIARRRHCARHYNSGVASERQTHVDRALFLQRLTNVEHRPVVFLVGAALVAPPSPGAPGVPDVAGMVDLIRQRYVTRGPEALGAFAHALSTSKESAYQAALRHLFKTHGPDEVARMIREAVLRARLSVASDHHAAAIRGDAESCRRLEHDVDGWSLPPAVESLGRLIASRRDAYGRYVLTTNFDPLIEIAIRRAQGTPVRTVLQRDGRFTDVDAEDGSHVVHLHGDWFRSDTLHTPQQLRQDRPRLASALRDVVKKQTLVVMGYGGWNDIVTDKLAEIVDDDDAAFDIVWAFYERDPE